MFNARLGVELFLKGMIVLRDPDARTISHVLEKLGPLFASLYPETECQWSIPFRVQVVGGTEDERQAAVKEAIKRHPLDQVFRYPSDNKGQPWEMVENVSLSWFVGFVEQIRRDMARIRSVIGL